MPKDLENKLKREALAKGYSGDRADAYVYGTMRKTGWRPGGIDKVAKPKKEKRQMLKGPRPRG